VSGVVAFIVSQRTREIGVRVALGARREDVLGLVGQYAARPVLAGCLIGLVAAFWVSRIVAGFVFGATTVDSLVLVATVAVILLVAAVAVIAPARAASPSIQSGRCAANELLQSVLPGSQHGRSQRRSIAGILSMARR
jgi:ABC-type antimicrobial peptide transport system permease subunit